MASLSKHAHAFYHHSRQQFKTPPASRDEDAGGLFTLVAHATIAYAPFTPSAPRDRGGLRNRRWHWCCRRRR